MIYEVLRRQTLEPETLEPTSVLAPVVVPDVVGVAGGGGDVFLDPAAIGTSDFSLGLSEHEAVIQVHCDDLQLWCLIYLFHCRMH